MEAGSVAAADPLMSFLPLVIISIPIAIGNFFLARRIEGQAPAYG